jgi:hypothetical protein
VGARLKAFTPEQETAIWKFKANGKNSDQIAEELHVSRDRVERILRGDRRAEEQEQALRQRVHDAIADGLHKTEITRRLHISPVVFDRYASNSPNVPYSARGGITLVNPLTDDQWRYLAGAFDANGGVALRRSPNKVAYVIEFRGREAFVEYIRELLGTGTAVIREGNRCTLRLTAYADLIAVCEGMRPYSTISSVLDRIIASSKSSTKGAREEHRAAT